MSNRQVLHIFCDKPGCDRKFVSHNLMLAEVREKAKEDGWSSDGTRDYCPVHSIGSNFHHELIEVIDNSDERSYPSYDLIWKDGNIEIGSIRLDDHEGFIFSPEAPMDFYLNEIYSIWEVMQSIKDKLEKEGRING